VDSEHNAILQCLPPGLAATTLPPYVAPPAGVLKLWLTASGGPFRGRSRADLAGVTKAQALRHPNWSMGAKITIDSASLMNKGLEVIEAHWLFGVPYDAIEVVVHPQSIVHSCVQFRDGSLKAQLGLPDMKLPIAYALGYPERVNSPFDRFDFMAYPTLTFEQPDYATFRNLALAYEAGKQGGTAPAVLNAANEVAVARFLRDEIEFLELTEIVEDALARVPFAAAPDLEGLLAADAAARRYAAEWTPLTVNPS
jgi:1-deoxy-D-xylulose-5-phosphate reductoisomerase